LAPVAVLRQTPNPTPVATSWLGLGDECKYERRRKEMDADTDTQSMIDTQQNMHLVLTKRYTSRTDIYTLKTMTREDENGKEIHG
jgi:acyl-homoserine lactone acylase PvdQ